MSADGHVSAPASQRAAEVQDMLLNPAARAIVPPWGGETAIDLVGLLDWQRIAAAEPTWVVGYSDISTLITPLTLMTGWASIHGQNLMDTPYVTPAGLTDWLSIVQMAPGQTFTQTSPGAHRPGFVDYVAHPDVSEYVLDTPSRWTRLDEPGAPVDVRGRLIGGCIETLVNLAGTRYLDTSRLSALGDPLVVYVEAAGDDAFTICRNLHGMRLAGFFDDAAAVLVGRTYAPDGPTLTQTEAASMPSHPSACRFSAVSTAATGRRTCRSSTARCATSSTTINSRASRRPWPESSERPDTGPLCFHRRRPGCRRCITGNRALTRSKRVSQPT